MASRLKHLNLMMMMMMKAIRDVEGDPHMKNHKNQAQAL